MLCRKCAFINKNERRANAIALQKERTLLSGTSLPERRMHMNSAIDNSADAPKATVKSHSCSAELYNDRTHDSTVDTDGKNHEAARIAGQSPIAVDEITTSNATLVNSVAEALDGMAGFDSRVGGNHLLLALEPGYTVVDKGMVEPQGIHSAEDLFDYSRAGENRGERGRIHYALNHLRPTRVIEIHRVR